MTYARLKKLIERGAYKKEDMLNKLDVFLMANRITEEQYQELVGMMMKGDKRMTGVFCKVNMIGGALLAAMAAVLGKYWFLFAGFLAFNLIDWLTGWAKSRMKGESCSKVGAIGAMKKVWYWVVIAIAFYIGFSFAQMGETIGVGLGFMQFIGWFVLANYLVNEIRSILENLVEMGVNVPPMLIKGLKIAAERIDAAASIGGEDDGK